MILLIIAGLVIIQKYSGQKEKIQNVCVVCVCMNEEGREERKGTRNENECHPVDTPPALTRGNRVAASLAGVQRHLHSI